MHRPRSDEHASAAKLDLDVIWLRNRLLLRRHRPDGEGFSLETPPKAVSEPQESERLLRLTRMFPFAHFRIGTTRRPLANLLNELVGLFTPTEILAR